MAKRQQQRGLAALVDRMERRVCGGLDVGGSDGVGELGKAVGG